MGAVGMRLFLLNLAGLEKGLSREAILSALSDSFVAHCMLFCDRFFDFGARGFRGTDFL